MRPRVTSSASACPSPGTTPCLERITITLRRAARISSLLWDDLDRQQQKLTASDAASGDSFGVRVSISGDYAVVGAYYDNSLAGSAYIFVRSGTTWTQQQKLTASDAASGDLFGVSVSISGDTAVVGAYANDDAGTNSGSAYIFVRSGTTWTQQQKLNALMRPRVTCSPSVSVSGDTAVVGAPYNDDGGSDSGSAYVFFMLCDASTAPTNGGVGSCELIGVRIRVPGRRATAGTPCQGRARAARALTAATCSANAYDASTAPTNGGVGSCTSSLASGPRVSRRATAGTPCPGRVLVQRGHLDRGDVRCHKYDERLVLDDANIAGIAIACFVFVVGVAVGAYVCVRRRTRGGRRERQPER